jgi:hypothetical protein
LSADSATRLFCWVIDAAAATSADSVTLFLGWTDIGWSTYERIQTFIYRTQGKKLIHANSLKLVHVHLLLAALIELLPKLLQICLPSLFTFFKLLCMFSPFCFPFFFP